MDKAEWLRCWGFEEGTPEAESAWANKQTFDADTRVPYVFGDMEPYRSPIDGSIVSSRSNHRDHMRQHGVVEMGTEYPKSRERDNAPLPRAGYDIVRSLEASR